MLEERVEWDKYLFQWSACYTAHPVSTACRSWVDWCQTHWLCGTNYEHQQYFAGYSPPCPRLPANYTSPPEPGLCQFNTSSQSCGFNTSCECGNHVTYHELTPGLLRRSYNCMSKEHLISVPGRSYSLLSTNSTPFSPMVPFLTIQHSSHTQHFSILNPSRCLSQWEAVQVMRPSVSHHLCQLSRPTLLLSALFAGLLLPR